MLKTVFLALLCIVKPVASWVNFFDNLSDAAISLTDQKVTYDPTYVTIPYPNGDVAPDKGVCTDVIIRAYRKVGIDLQKEVHQDMVAHFDLYPNIWGLKKADANIDHRRVQNLMVFFERHGARLPMTLNAADYKPGDIVTWDLGHGIVHIGVMVDRLSTDDKKRRMMVHNMGGGQVLADCLFNFHITGHYRYGKVKG
ncbi:MAG: hypothetical protein JWO03_1144 [Bacteroidetes bacterium]|nr:hypothetical protein [Bacteroidota bacterium]